MGTHLKSTQPELSTEYQHDRVKMVFENLCNLLIRTKVALVLEGLNYCCLEIHLSRIQYNDT